MNSHTSIGQREGDENYAGVVLVVNSRWRIIECRDGIQWILQRRASAEGATTAQWRGIKHYRDRENLVAALVRLKIPLTPDQRAVLEALPEWIEEGLS